MCVGNLGVMLNQAWVRHQHLLPLRSFWVGYLTATRQDTICLVPTDWTRGIAAALSNQPPAAASINAKMRRFFKHMLDVPVPSQGAQDFREKHLAGCKVMSRLLPQFGGASLCGALEDLASPLDLSSYKRLL